MPDIASRTLFSGGNDISPNDIGNAEVSNFSTDIDARLRDVYKWKGRCKCNHIWENAAPDNILIVNFPTLDIFTFEEGGPPSSHTIGFGRQSSADQLPLLPA